MGYITTTVTVTAGELLHHRPSATGTTTATTMANNEAYDEAEEDRDDFEDVRHDLNLDEATMEDALKTYQDIKVNFKLEVSGRSGGDSTRFLNSISKSLKGRKDGLDRLRHLLLLPTPSDPDDGPLED